MTILGAINEHPMAAIMVIVTLLIINQIIGKWRGKTDATTTERESLTLAQQTSATVNKCAAENSIFRKTIEKHLAPNDLGHISAKLNNEIKRSEKVDADTSISKVSLAGLNRVSDSIADDLRRGDHRVVHTGIINQIDDVKRIAEDTKQLAVHIAEKI